MNLIKFHVKLKILCTQNEKCVDDSHSYSSIMRKVSKNIIVAKKPHIYCSNETGFLKFKAIPFASWHYYDSLLGLVVARDNDTTLSLLVETSKLS